MHGDAVELQIGWAWRDLTPTRPVLLRGMSYARVGREAADPVTVTALAVSADSGERAILVSADLGAIDEPTLAQARRILAGLAPDFDPGFLVVNATHTHTSLSGLTGIYPQPNGDCMTPEETVAFMGETIARAAAAAWQCRRRGAVAWGYGHAVVGHNRRATYASGESRMYGRTDVPDFSHIEGYEDHGVDLLFTFGEQGEVTGVVIDLACPAQCSASSSLISADFWHEARAEIRRLLGSAVFVLPQCSAAGDQSPSLLLHRAAETRMLALKEGVPAAQLDFPMAQRREIGRRIAAAVGAVLPVAARDIRHQVPFSHRTSVCALPVYRITDADRREAQRHLAEAEAQLRQQDPRRDWRQYSIPYRQVHRYRRLLERDATQGQEATRAVEIHGIRLGDVAIVTNPFELFLDYGEQIKARSRATQTFVVQLAGNGSYVPTERSVAGKGYGAEPVSNPVGAAGGRMLVEETLRLIASLYGDGEP